MSLTAINLQSLVAQHHLRGDWYAAVRVCRMCFSIHSSCSALEDFGCELTSLLGIKHQRDYRLKPIPESLSRSRASDPTQNHLPDSLMMCRLLVNFRHVSVSRSRHSRITHVSYNIFGGNTPAKQCVAVNQVTSRIRENNDESMKIWPIEKSRLVYFFTTKERYYEFMRTAIVELHLLSCRGPGTKHRTILGRASVKLAQFSSPLSIIQDMVVGFGGSSGHNAFIRVSATLSPIETSD